MVILSLELGNEEAQQIMYEHFLSSKDDGFFFCLRAILRGAVADFRDHAGPSM